MKFRRILLLRTVILKVLAFLCVFIQRSNASFPPIDQWRVLVPEVAVMQHEGSLTNAIFRYPTSSSSFTPLSLSSEPKRKPKAGPNQFLQPNTNPSAFTNARDEEPESVEWGHGGMGSIKGAKRQIVPLIIFITLLWLSEWFINLKHKAFPWVFGRRTQDRDYDEFGTHTAHTPHVLYEPHSSFKPTPSPIDHEYLQPPRFICKKKALLVGVQRPLEGLHKDVQDMRQFLIGGFRFSKIIFRTFIDHFTGRSLSL